MDGISCHGPLDQAERPCRVPQIPDKILTCVLIIGYKQTNKQSIMSHYSSVSAELLIMILFFVSFLPRPIRFPPGDESATSLRIMVKRVSAVRAFSHPDQRQGPILVTQCVTVKSHFAFSSVEASKILRKRSHGLVKPDATK